jgi:SAM-dependent methyltransferase
MVPHEPSAPATGSYTGCLPTRETPARDTSAPPEITRLAPAAEAQAFSVKRAEVEFHNFASLGEPERVMAHYTRQNDRRRILISDHREFIGALSPFLEIGANAGHSSYMLANDFGAEGFALDISADSLRYGVALQEHWGYIRAPVRVAGDALNLPFANGSLRFVMAHQMLSQFMSIESVFLEVKRVLAPGGVFLFSEEPLLRGLSLRLYRCPYYETMKPWERKLYDWGLLGYLVRDVIGAHQEQSFGIRQNHTMGLREWDELIRKHFADQEYEICVPERGWGERWVKRLAVRISARRSHVRAARLLGGTLAAICRKEGVSEPHQFEPFERLLRCPDCGGRLRRDQAESLRCTVCAYAAACEGGVYNLLRSTDRAELYPGDREDIIDFTLPGHERRLGDGWHELEGVYGNRWRWMSGRAEARLVRVKSGQQRIRIRGSAVDGHIPVHLVIHVNGIEVSRSVQDRPGLFVVEADVPESPEYRVSIEAGPTWQAPGDGRVLTVTVGMVRLVPRE